MSRHESIARQLTAPEASENPPEISFSNLFSAIKTTNLWIQSLNCGMLLRKHTTPKSCIFSPVFSDHFVYFLAEFISTFFHINRNEYSVSDFE
jgi:hypothetical protein